MGVLPSVLTVEIKAVNLTFCNGVQFTDHWLADLQHVRTEQNHSVHFMRSYHTRGTLSLAFTTCVMCLISLGGGLPLFGTALQHTAEPQQLNYNSNNKAKTQLHCSYLWNCGSLPSGSGDKIESKWEPQSVTRVYLYLSRHGEEKRFWWRNLRDKDHFEDPGAEGRIILRWIFRELDVGMYWIELARDRDRWRAFVNSVMNLRFP